MRCPNVWIFCRFQKTSKCEFRERDWEFSRTRFILFKVTRVRKHPKMKRSLNTGFSYDFTQSVPDVFFSFVYTSFIYELHVYTHTIIAVSTNSLTFIFKWRIVDSNPIWNYTKKTRFSYENLNKNLQPHGLKNYQCMRLHNPHLALELNSWRSIVNLSCL